ncbi:MAG: uracil-DNA glycosylase [Chitinophagales bacterium]
MTTEAIQIDAEWKAVLSAEFRKAYFQNIRYFLKREKEAGKIIYPPGGLIFHAFNRTPFSAVRVVILGQDPYHGPGQAQGLCFSVPEGISIPPSLVNIYKELNSDVGKAIPTSGNLEHWADQGVFLLNAILTVEKDKPASHQHIGWQYFTDAAIEALSREREHLVFMLWGSFAQQKAQLIDAQKHCILRAPHPSPLSAHRGFLGCTHFSLANTYLQKHGMQPIGW